MVLGVDDPFVVVMAVFVIVIVAVIAVVNGRLIANDARVRPTILFSFQDIVSDVSGGEAKQEFPRSFTFVCCPLFGTRNGLEARSC